MSKELNRDQAERLLIAVEEIHAGADSYQRGKVNALQDWRIIVKHHRVDIAAWAEQLGMDTTPFNWWCEALLGKGDRFEMDVTRAGVWHFLDELRKCVVGVLKTPPSPPESIAIIKYIDLDQAAALVNRSKKTLERALRNGKMPLPDVQGGGGKKHEWDYGKLRPWLEEQFDRKLPDAPPHTIR